MNLNIINGRNVEALSTYNLEASTNEWTSFRVLGRGKRRQQLLTEGATGA